MSTCTRRSPMPVPADELYAWHARAGAFERLTPPWEGVRVVAREGRFEHLRTTLRVRVGLVRAEWVAEHFDTVPGRQFRDRQRKGPFAEWVHTHRTEPTGPEASVLEDVIEWRLPGGPLGRLLGEGFVRRRLARLLAYRHRVTASDLRRHARFRGRPRLTVAVTGSRGLIGSELVSFLTTGGHRVVRLVTGPVRPPPFDDGTTWVPWDPAAAVDPAVLAGADAVVHLAAEPIAEGRWSRRKKRAILDSRAGPTRRLAETAARAGVRAFLSASAVGFYGDRGDEELTEESAAGTGFLADVCRAWEAAAEPAAAAGVRAAQLRFGVVLTPRGGALGKQLPAFRLGGGAVLGSGRQWVPWVGIGDAVGAVHHALMADDLRGPVNVVAPGAVRQRGFATSVGRVLRRPVFLHLPRWALRRLAGGLADEALLASARVLPRRLLATGFAFDGPDLEPELRHLLGR